MTIYIADKRKKEECMNFRTFWEKEWFPGIKRSLYKFCRETDGQIVNLELAERIAEDYQIAGCQYAPISDTLYKESLVTVKKAGVFWHNHIWDGIRISSLSELIQFFQDDERKMNYLLEDESGTIYTLNALCDEIAKHERRQL